MPQKQITSGFETRPFTNKTNKKFSDVTRGRYQLHMTEQPIINGLFFHLTTKTTVPSVSVHLAFFTMRIHLLKSN